jgi:hypothetical protein
MAFANSYTTDSTTTLGSAAANREDIKDILTILSPEDTPVLSMATKSAANSTFVETVVEDLADPSFAGVQEGTDASYSDKAATRAKLGNYIQLFNRGWQVSNVQERVSVAGIDNEIAHSETKCLKELKRDIEAAICSDDDRSAEDGSSSRYRLRGLGRWIADTAPTGHAAISAPSDIPTSYKTPTANINATVTGSLTESNLNAVLQSRYETVGAAADRLMLIAAPSLKRAITDFARSEGSTTSTPLTVNEEAGSRSLTLSISQYEGDFGIINIVPDLFLGRTSGAGGTLNSTRGYLLDPGLITVHTLKAESATENDDLGGGRRGFVDFIGTISVGSPLAHGKFDAAS